MIIRIKFTHELAEIDKSVYNASGNPNDNQGICMNFWNRYFQNSLSIISININCLKFEKIID